MKKTKSGRVAERAAVNNLLLHLRRKYKDALYIYVDRDAGALRHTSSGWDFLLAKDGKIVFVEAKVGGGKLTDYQEYTRQQILSARCWHVVLRFSNDGLSVMIDDAPVKRVESVKFEDFSRQKIKCAAR
jgi:hypothetical protein